MSLMKSANLAVRFLLEIAMLVSIGFWGFSTQTGWLLKILFGVGIPVIISILWGFFAAPKASRRLTGPALVLLELVLLGSGAAALFASQLVILGIIFTAALLVSTILMVIWNQQNFSSTHK
jgi:hypothetical protein